MKVQSIMATEVFCVNSEQSLYEAARLMWEHNCGSAPVVDEDNQMVGMVTDRDIAMAAYINGGSLDTIPVSVAQSKEVVCCKPDEDITDVLYKMRAYQLHRIPAVDDKGQPVGIVSLNDISCACKAGSKGFKAQDVSDTLAAICSKSMNKFGGSSSSAAA